MRLTRTTTVTGEPVVEQRHGHATQPLAVRNNLQSNHHTKGGPHLVEPVATATP
ncbi:hypothetical protein A2U01_0063174, partial [Trifolium medium]|nr:hypothetical protein [Trifolium medium]